jgi:hypothetical protein
VRRSAEATHDARSDYAISVHLSEERIVSTDDRGVEVSEELAHADLLGDAFDEHYAALGGAVARADLLGHVEEEAPRPQARLATSLATYLSNCSSLEDET